MPGRLRPMGNRFALEVEGIALWQSFPEAEIEELRRQWREHACWSSDDNPCGRRS